MSSYKSPDLQERQSNASAAKKAMLEQFRAASHDPAVAKRRAARRAVNEARSVRVGQREAANREREAELVKQTAHAHELTLQAQREAAEVEARIATEMAQREASLQAEQKVARDVRYAARKAAKKERRRGY
jgi:hypothetical protein